MRARGTGLENSEGSGWKMPVVTTAHDAGHPEVLSQKATLRKCSSVFPSLYTASFPVPPSVSSGSLNGLSVYDKGNEHFARILARALENSRPSVREASGVAEKEWDSACGL